MHAANALAALELHPWAVLQCILETQACLRFLIPAPTTLRQVWKFPEDVAEEDLTRCFAIGAPIAGDVSVTADGALVAFVKALVVRIRHAVSTTAVE